MGLEIPITVRWEEDLVQQMDRARGDVPRSVFIRRAVEAALDEDLVSTKITGIPPSELYRGRGQRTSAEVKANVNPIPKGKSSGT